jgi:hypothetical protein
VHSISHIWPAEPRPPAVPRPSLYLGALAALGYAVLAVMAAMAPDPQPNWTAVPGPDLAFTVAMQDFADLAAFDAHP